MDETIKKLNIRGVDIAKWLLLLNIFLTLSYFILITFILPRGNIYLFTALIFGEVFHIWQSFTYIITIWNRPKDVLFKDNFKEYVDVFITVAGEPVEIVQKTVAACKHIDYENFQIYILNDGLVANKENWRDVEQLAKKMNVKCITRTIPGGAKAGNINNALRQTSSSYVAVFDADHVPRKDFLKKTMGYFGDSKMGFVQSPQYYKNHQSNEITKGSWEQQSLFFNPICRGKSHFNSAFMCGTNMVISRHALVQAGGMCEDNIAEDFLTSLFIHSKGWKSIYVPEILAEGLAPEDFNSYYKQQLRWARGSLEIVFRHNPFLKKGLSLMQRIQYFASASYYLSGTIVLINAFMPVIFLFFGIQPLQISTMTLATLFLPYIAINLYTLQLSHDLSYTFRAVSFSFSSFGIYNKALISLLLGKKATFTVTSKTKESGNFLYLVSPHISYILLTFIGLYLAIYREGFSASVVSNLSWSIFNIVLFLPFISAATPEFNFSLKRRTKENLENIKSIPVTVKPIFQRNSIINLFNEK